jgi:RimJ/RimL family protein N-acetyltransferase
MPGPEHEDFRRIESPFLGRLVRLRPVEADDVTAINQGIWNPNVTRFLGGPGWPEPMAGTRAFLERARANEGMLLLAIETLAGELIGACSLEDISGPTRTATLGIWVGEPYWSHGYGTDAVRILCRFGFREMNLQRIDLGVHETNPRGIRAYEKVGFKEEGRRPRRHFVDGRYVDTVVMGLLAEDLIDS